MKMRPIDKDRLLPYLNNLWLATSPMDTDSKEVKAERAAMCRGIDNVIGEVERFPEVGGWISVKDKLPEESKNVLVYCKCGYMSSVSF
jgi:hypothetical protein